MNEIDRVSGTHTTSTDRSLSRGPLANPRRTKLDKAGHETHGEAQQ